MLCNDISKKIYICIKRNTDKKRIRLMRYKKGILFSLFVITALSLVVLTFKIQTEFKQEDRADIFKRRVERTNMFVEDLEFDIERSLYVSSFRAFVAIDEYMHDEDNDFIDNVTTILPELIMFGTFDGVKMNATNASTFYDWTRNMQDIAIKYFRLNLSLENSSVQVKQYSPWLIKIDFSTNVTIHDFDDIIAWNYTLTKETFIDIREANLPDPLYLVYSDENYLANVGFGSDFVQIHNNIEETHFTAYWDNSTGNVSTVNLLEHMINQYYRESPYGPSYLMRLEGRTNCSEPENILECQNFGIESMVNILDTNNIFDYSVDKVSKTCVIDYQFFAEGCSEMHNIINMSDEFFLDDKHLVLYDLTKINRT